MVQLEDLKNEAKRVLETEKVKYIIGYKRGASGAAAVPAFISKAEDVDQLVWDPTCLHNLARFLVDEKRKMARQKEPDTRPVGIVVKGCDSRALNVLLQEEYINREDVYILGVSCEHAGVIDEKKLKNHDKTAGATVTGVSFNGSESIAVTTDKGKSDIPIPDLLSQRCIECKANYPVVKDVTFGEEVKRVVEKPFAEVERVEALGGEERWVFWKERFDKCIRCYACRSVCPMCYCEECVVDTINFAVTADTGAEEKAQKIKWIERSPAASENAVYHLVRAMHLAGRCIDCGECERVCPVDIPIRLLNKKLEKESKELFDYEAGFDPEKPSLVSSFRDEDPEDFIR